MTISQGSFFYKLFFLHLLHTYSGAKSTATNSQHFLPTLANQNELRFFSGRHHFISHHRLLYSFFQHSRSSFQLNGASIHLSRITISHHNNEQYRCGLYFLLLHVTSSWLCIHQIIQYGIFIAYLPRKKQIREHHLLIFICWFMSKCKCYFSKRKWYIAFWSELY